jgi:hypothetical protein
LPNHTALCYDKRKGGEIMKLVNGNAVPDSYTIDQLREILDSSDMQTFALACEALQNTKEAKAYQVLKAKLQEKDRYRYRYLLSVIFSFDESAELQEHFKNALLSDDTLLVTTALEHLIRKNIWVTDEQIFSCFEKNHNNLNGYYYQILLRIARTESHTIRMINLLNNSQTDSVKIAVAECLTEFTTTENFHDIYELFANSSISKLRMEACRIANKFGRVDLLQAFANDSDGHVRKYVKQLCDKIIS